MLSDRVRGLLARLRARIDRRGADRELEDEIRFHLEMETEAGVRRGLDPREARRRALVRFGGVERFTERTRETRGILALETAARHLRLATRRLGAEPGFAAAAVTTLALGLGGVAVVFSAVDAVLLAPSPFPDPDRLVMVWETDRNSGTRHEPASWPDVEDFRARSRSLSALGAVRAANVTLSVDGEPERVGGLAVTPDVPGILGLRPLVGRSFTADDGPWGPPYTVLLGEALWRERFGADPGVVGRTVTLNGGPATVLGVLPAGADLGVLQVHERADYTSELTGRRVDVWIAMVPNAAVFPRTTHPLLALGRLAPEVTREDAQEELDAIARELEETYPENAGRGVNVEAYHDVVFGPVRPALAVILAAVALVLLVACANAANLVLARATTREREMALRAVLGARRHDLLGQLLVEGTVLAAAGGAAAVVVAWAGLPALVAAAPPDIPRLEEAALGGRTLLLLLGATAAVGLVLGTLPRLHLRGAGGPPEAGGAGSGDTSVARGLRATAGGGARQLRSALVVAEVAVAVVLVAGAALLLRSFQELRRVDPGFRAEGVLVAGYQLPEARYPVDFSRWPDLPEIQGFHAGYLRRVRETPGVAAAALAGQHPLDPGFTNSFVIRGRETEAGELPEIRTRFLSPGYLDVVGLPLLAGRDLGPGDVVGAPGVGLLNRAAAERFFPAGDALDQVVTFWGTPWRIVGVVGNERFRGLDRPAEPAVYVPLAQTAQPSVVVVARPEAGDPLELVAPLRRALLEMDDQVALHRPELLRSAVAATLAEPRFTALLLGLMAAAAAALALVGVHGVLAYAVARRSREMGIRMALGASRRAVLTSVLGEGMALAAVGVALGLAGVLAFGGALASLVFRVTPRDPAVLGAVAGGALLVSAVASVLPALRATRADPSEALRAE